MGGMEGVSTTEGEEVQGGGRVLGREKGGVVGGWGRGGTPCLERPTPLKYAPPLLPCNCS